ncbi:hypothetical protein [Luteitalea sp.]
MKQMLATALLTLAFTVAAFAADITGKWKASIDGPQGAMDLVFTFKADGDKFGGTVASPMGDLPLSDIKVDGEKIEFTVATDQFSVVHKGTVAGDEMTLSFDMMGETRQMVARRQAP